MHHHGGGAHHASGGMYHQDDVTSLRHRVADLELSLAKAEARIEDTKALERDMESVQLEVSVAQRNCDIQKSNVDTLKSLCVQLAEQLEEAKIRIRTSEEKLSCKALRDELAAASEIEAVKRDYEGRMDTLRKELKQSTASINDSSQKWTERELEQDRRMRRLEQDKDETILKLLRENTMLKKVLSSATNTTGGGSTSSNSGGKGHDGSSWASGAVSTPNRRVAPLPAIDVAGCIQDVIDRESNQRGNTQSSINRQPAHPDLSEVAKPNEILTFSLQQRDVVEYHSTLVSPRRRLEAMGGSRWPKSPTSGGDEDTSVALGSSPIRARGVLGTSQPFASSAAAEAARYHVEVGVNDDELETIDSTYFDELANMRGVEVQRRMWAFRTLDRRAVRLTMESL